MNDLIEIQKISPRILLDIVYATERNFTGRAVYTSARCFLRLNTAHRLHRVQLALEKQHLGLKIFDGYRPLSVQKIFWELLPNTHFVADPKIGSKHNRGTSVDLTLVNEIGLELPMPSAFDEFSEKASSAYPGGTPDERRNRDLLGEVMVAEGFIRYANEWWHFDDPDWKQYPILDIPIEAL